jgi:hypothetical protein
MTDDPSLPPEIIGIRRPPDPGGRRGPGRAGGREYRWIVDPIDGTRGFARGLPTFGHPSWRSEEPGAAPRTSIGRESTLPLTNEDACGQPEPRTAHSERSGASGVGRPQTCGLRSSRCRTWREFRAAGMGAAYTACPCGPAITFADITDRMGFTRWWSAARWTRCSQPALSPWDVSRRTEVLIARSRRGVPIARFAGRGQVRSRLREPGPRRTNRGTGAVRMRAVSRAAGASRKGATLALIAIAACGGPSRPAVPVPDPGSRQLIVVIADAGTGHGLAPPIRAGPGSSQLASGRRLSARCPR